jgi:U3 small nucleolar RNA-associated protein 10
MQQGALVALESFVRSLCHVSEKSKLTSKAADAFVPALESVTKLFGSTAASWSKEESDKDDVEMLGIRDSECQLLSSCSLCLSSLVAVLKARCLRLLPSILKPLMSSLKSINLSVESTDFQSESSETMLQISILRLLETLADTLPQFLPPYLPLIFSKNALPSRALRRSESNSLKEATERVESALALKTPIRQLTPALSKALSNILDNSNDGVSGWEEACSILGVINASVETSERSELSPVIGKIFNVLVAAYGYEGEDDCRIRLLSDANKLLLSLVMKLSESQLRQLYARLREWRGDIKEGDGNLNQSCTRRVAFWSLSAALSKSLRSIFLPCLTSCLTDLIDELEIAVSRLCERSKPDGSKRRRINDSDNDSSVDDDSDVSPLQPLLLCLESALKADAHEGGDWTRGDDNQRYNMILSYLGKLLMAQVPKDIPLTSDLSQKEGAATSTYQKLVEGFGTLDHGNVVGCLTALAAAAGNEQLWKPLNFAVLKACSHKRPEVRKAGISCLLSIIETVGEEYMVLLPECLPVLSELLEEGDEEIAAMAKECVRQGEEMLGESLQDSLR